LVGRLAPVSWEELVRRLRRLGFEGPYWGGRHPLMVRAGSVLVVPNPHRGDVGVISGGLVGRRRLISDHGVPALVDGSTSFRHTGLGAWVERQSRWPFKPAAVGLV